MEFAFQVSADADHGEVAVGASRPVTDDGAEEGCLAIRGAQNVVAVGFRERAAHLFQCGLAGTAFKIGRGTATFGASPPRGLNCDQFSPTAFNYHNFKATDHSKLEQPIDEMKILEQLKLILEG